MDSLERADAKSLLRRRRGVPEMSRPDDNPRGHSSARGDARRSQLHGPAGARTAHRSISTRARRRGARVLTTTARPTPNPVAIRGDRTPDHARARDRSCISRAVAPRPAKFRDRGRSKTPPTGSRSPGCHNAHTRTEIEKAARFSYPLRKTLTRRANSTFSPDGHSARRIVAAAQLGSAMSAPTTTVPFPRLRTATRLLRLDRSRSSSRASDLIRALSAVAEEPEAARDRR